MEKTITKESNPMRADGERAPEAITTVDDFCALHRITREEFNSMMEPRRQMLGDLPKVELGDGEVVDGLDKRQEGVATLEVAMRNL
ncbi:MAG: hypothetical protein LBL08_02225 [Candidatus Nomurabacteria bacterium]|jgi:hypothetical protein|nr:hypothetical protein [Candidatus Nomurabacteria bacterium]